ncbi:hypothetical protein [Streptomyces sp. MUSC 14]|nr:hypothetical protein [Streptomyces sp. MUSC 14]
MAREDRPRGPARPVRPPRHTTPVPGDTGGALLRARTEIPAPEAVRCS